MAVQSVGEICVEVVYAEPLRVVCRTYQLAVGATLSDVMRLATDDSHFTGIDLTGSAVGIFGQIAGVNTVLVNGDRVEIYRPLAADPKNARRARVREARRRN